MKNIVICLFALNAGTSIHAMPTRANLQATQHRLLLVQATLAQRCPTKPMITEDCPTKPLIIDVCPTKQKGGREKARLARSVEALQVQIDMLKKR